MYNSIMPGKTRSLLINNIPAEIKVETADTFTKRLLGWIGRKTPGTALLITRCNSIHTFFMRFNIDAVFLNAENRIIKTVHNIYPWSVILPVKNAKSVLELPNDALKNLNIKPGDSLKFLLL